MKHSKITARRELKVGNSGQHSLYPFPFLDYVAVIAQAGTADPTATVLANKLGGDVVLARTGAGVYTLTLADAFTADKVFIQATVATGSTAAAVEAVRTSANVITVSTFAADSSTAADLVGSLFLEIRVYA